MTDALTLDLFAKQQNPWYARMSNHATAQTVSAPGTLTYDTADYDPLGRCGLLGGTGANYNAPVNGLYLCGVTFGVTTDLDLSLALYLSGTQISHGTEITGSATHYTTGTVIDLVPMNAGQYIQGGIAYISASGSAVLGEYDNYLWVVLLREF